MEEVFIHALASRSYVENDLIDKLPDEVKIEVMTIISSEN